MIANMELSIILSSTEIFFQHQNRTNQNIIISQLKQQMMIFNA